MLAIKGSPANHDTQTSDLGHMLIYISICHSSLWLYQTQGLFIICVPDTDVTEDSYSKCSWTASYYLSIVK